MDIIVDVFSHCLAIKSVSYLHIYLLLFKSQNFFIFRTM